MMRSTPLRVEMSSWSATSSGVPFLKLPPVPAYEPSVFSRKITKSMSAARKPFSGYEAIVEASDRPRVDVQVEDESGAEQDVARVRHVRDARVAERAHEDRVVVRAQVVERAFRQRLARLQVVVRAPGEFRRRDVELPGLRRGAQDFQRLFRDVDADPVAGNDRDSHGFHRARG